MRKYLDGKDRHDADARPCNKYSTYSIVPVSVEYIYDCMTWLHAVSLGRIPYKVHMQGEEKVWST